MTGSRSLPPRPSLESLRKQAKKLARDRSVSLRDAQLAVAREYGYAGWQDLTAEVSKRVGSGLEWAVAEADRLIHDNDTERLKRLLAEYPALLSWRADKKGRGLLGMATGAYGDAGDPQREQWFTRGACAELLIDAGAVVAPSICESILQSRARGLLDLFRRKGLLPRTLKFFAALGDLEAVRAALGENGDDAAVVALINEAFVRACLFHHEAVALLLLERAITLDPELGDKVDGRPGQLAFVRSLLDTQPENVREIAGRATTVGLWKVFVMKQVTQAVHERDLTAFVGALQREPWLLGDDFVWFQDRLIGIAALNDGLERFVSALLDFHPAILRRQPPPPSQNIEQALTYATTHLLPLLTRIWPVPDDLAHAAGMGDLSRVKRWFDADGKPALGDLAYQTPTRAGGDHGTRSAQQVLDTAFAWAVINHHFDVADFLLAHGANVSTDWNSHEPASILHHLVFLPDPYERMQFLIDRGIDLTMTDYRWGSTAAGWARHALRDEKMAQWLEEAERQREPKR